jgi:uncharacterized short protein YbdD (DUF466 family)
MGTLFAALRSGAAGVSWYFKAVMGEDAYAKYLAHHQSQHFDGKGLAAETHVMTEREFWRDHSDRQTQNPQGRCC